MKCDPFDLWSYKICIMFCLFAFRFEFSYSLVFYGTVRFRSLLKAWFLSFRPVLRDFEAHFSVAFLIISRNVTCIAYRTQLDLVMHWNFTRNHDEMFTRKVPIASPTNLFESTFGLVIVHKWKGGKNLKRINEVLSASHGPQFNMQ